MSTPVPLTTDQIARADELVTDGPDESSGLQTALDNMLATQVQQQFDDGIYNEFMNTDAVDIEALIAAEVSSLDTSSPSGAPHAQVNGTEYPPTIPSSTIGGFQVLGSPPSPTVATYPAIPVETINLEDWSIYQTINGTITNVTFSAIVPIGSTITLDQDPTGSVGEEINITGAPLTPYTIAAPVTTTQVFVATHNLIAFIGATYSITKVGGLFFQGTTAAQIAHQKVFEPSGVGWNPTQEPEVSMQFAIDRFRSMNYLRYHPSFGTRNSFGSEGDYNPDLITGLQDNVDDRTTFFAEEIGVTP